MAAQRATRLTRQLLAFSRQQVLEPPGGRSGGGASSDLQPIIAAARSARTSVASSRYAEAAAARVDRSRSVRADRCSNLVINARDAMPGGGQSRSAVLDRVRRDAATRRSSTSHQGRLRRWSRSTTPAKGIDAETARAHLRTVLHDQGARAAAPASACRPCSASSVRAAAPSRSARRSSRARRSASTSPLSEADGRRSRARTPPQHRLTRSTSTILLAEDEPGVRAFLEMALTTRRPPRDRDAQRQPKRSEVAERTSRRSTC